MQKRFNLFAEYDGLYAEYDGGLYVESRVNLGYGIIGVVCE